MTLIVGSPRVQYFYPETSEPLSGGKLYSYVAGTDTAKATYPSFTDALAGTNANSNPIVLDSSGSAMVVLEGATKLVLKDSNDNIIWTEDNLDQSDPSVVTVDGSEVISLTNVTSAVNLWDLSNNSTGNGPILSATGDDTNIDGRIKSKAAGKLYLDGGATGDLELNQTSTGTIRLRRATAASSTLTVAGNITASSALTVAGTFTPSGSTVLVNSSVDIMPPGMVMWRASSNVPTGWLECDGSAVSRTTYANLFAEIGTTYGVGDNSTTFNLPTQSRRTIVGKGGSGTSTLANTVGSTGGEETHTLTSSEMPSHTHAYTATTVATFNAQGGGNPIFAVTGNPGANTSSVGSGSAHNIIQPSIVMMMIIKI